MKRSTGCMWLAGAMILILSGNMGYASDLLIESITVTRPVASECSCQWQAAVRNTGAQAIDGTKISVQGYQGNAGGVWTPGSGTILGNLGTNQSAVRGSSFLKKADSTRFKIVLFSQGSTLTEKIVDLEPESPLTLAIENCTISDTGYEVEVQNLSGIGFSGLTVQGSAASSAEPNVWKPAGGMTIDCIQAGGVYRRSGSKPSGYDMIRVQVRSGSQIVAERIFNFAPEPAPNEQQEPLQKTLVPARVPPVPKRKNRLH